MKRAETLLNRDGLISGGDGPTGSIDRENSSQERKRRRSDHLLKQTSVKSTSDIRQPLRKRLSISCDQLFTLRAMEIDSFRPSPTSSSDGNLPLFSPVPPATVTTSPTHRDSPESLSARLSVENSPRTREQTNGRQ